MNVAIGQHSIPKFYLKEFSQQRSGKNDVVSVLDFKTGKLHPSSVNKATVVNNRNTYDQLGAPSYEFEEYLRDHEGAGSAAINAMKDGQWPLDFRKRRNLAAFMSTMYIRGDWIRLVQDEIHDYNSSLSEQDLSINYKQRCGSFLSPEEAKIVKRLFQDERSPDDRARQQYQMMKMYTSELTKRLERGIWTQIQLSSGFFITGDLPLTAMDSKLNPASLTNAKTVVFPTGRKTGVSIVFPTAPPQACLGFKDRVKTTRKCFSTLVNKVIAVQSPSFVCCHPDDDDFLKAIPKDQYGNRLTVRLSRE